MRNRQWFLITMLAPVGLLGLGAASAQSIPVDRFASLALDCVHQEYPNKIGHVLNSDRDVAPPRQLTPTFFGCFDWHSSVHGHWLLVRLAKRFPDAAFVPAARAALEESFTPEKIAAEVRYLKAEGRKSFERPYGLAWLLCLADELHTWKDDADAARWSKNVSPLERIAADRFRQWLEKLHYPIRTGEHSQTAFAFGLVHDWAKAVGDSRMVDLIAVKSRDFYFDDVGCPMDYEPSGQDFLSPCIAEADLMRRILTPKAFTQWLETFLPGIPQDGSSAWLPVGIVTDRSDGKLAHLDGLNLSRAWMLEGVASALSQKDPRRESLLAAAGVHRTAGLSSVTGEHYAGGHWLGSFASYLVTEKGLERPAEVEENSMDVLPEVP